MGWDSGSRICSGANTVPSSCKPPSISSENPQQENPVLPPPGIDSRAQPYLFLHIQCSNFPRFNIQIWPTMSKLHTGLNMKTKSKC